MERQIKSLAFKAGNIQGDGVFEGYAAVFGNIDSWGDLIKPGAFKKTLSQHAARDSRPALLWQHRSEEPIGVWDDLKEDQNGLAVKGRLLIDDVRRAKEVHALLKAGAVSGLSIGYLARDYDFDSKTRIRTLKEIDLLEASLVTFPANDQARVAGLKARPETIREFEAFLRDAGGFSANEAKRIASIGFKLRDEAGPAGEAAAIIKQITQKYQGV